MANVIVRTPELKAKIISTYFNNLNIPFSQMAKLAGVSVNLADEIVMKYLKNPKEEQFLIFESKLNKKWKQEHKWN